MKQEGEVDVTECVHCGGVTLNAETDQCQCGQELYPVTRRVPRGTRIFVKDGVLVIAREKS